MYPIDAQLRLKLNLDVFILCSVLTFYATAKTVTGRIGKKYFWGQCDQFYVNIITKTKYCLHAGNNVKIPVGNRRSSKAASSINGENGGGIRSCLRKENSWKIFLYGAVTVSLQDNRVESPPLGGWDDGEGVMAQLFPTRKPLQLFRGWEDKQ